MRKILLIVHQETTDPGLVGRVLRANDCTLEVCCPAVGQPLLKTMADYDGTVVFGGPMSANDDNTLPYIRAELDWIEMAIASDKPYLGICLGAQMLARVLGAKVAPHPEALREIGYTPIQPTIAAQNSFERPMQVYQWHKEGFELPSDAVLLAAGEVFPHQAFRYGDRAYGLQFHPEITETLIELWISRAGEQLSFPGAQPREEQLQKHAHFGTTVEDWLQNFLSRWLGGGE